MPPSAMALHAACALGDLSVVRRLIGEGADIDGTASGLRPLIAAALGGHHDIARTLLSEGCDPSAVDAGGHTAAGIAKQRGDHTILRLLYASRGATLYREVVDARNLEEEMRLLREVEAELSEDDDDDDDGVDRSDSDDADSDEGGTHDGATAPSGVATPPEPTAGLARLSVLLARPGRGAAVLHGCDDEQLDELRACMEAALSEVTTVQRQRRLKQKEEQPAGQCQICVDAPTNSVFAPCGHVVACYTCATACARCPICRGAIGSVIKTFFS